MSDHTIGDGPVQPEAVDRMKAIARVIDDFVNPDDGEKRWGFVLMLFPFGEGEDHRCNYMSNAQRADIINVLKEQIARFEGQPDMKGHA